MAAGTRLVRGGPRRRGDGCRVPRQQRRPVKPAGAPRPDENPEKESCNALHQQVVQSESRPGPLPCSARAGGPRPSQRSRWRGGCCPPPAASAAQSAVEAILPAGGGSNPQAFMESVSCPSAGNCTAAGEYLDSSGNQQGLLVQEILGTWRRMARRPCRPTWDRTRR